MVRIRQNNIILYFNISILYLVNPRVIISRERQNAATQSPGIQLNADGTIYNYYSSSHQQVFSYYMEIQTHIIIPRLPIFSNQVQ